MTRSKITEKQSAYAAFLRELLDRFRHADMHDDATLERFVQEGAHTLSTNRWRAPDGPGAVEGQVTKLPIPPEEASTLWDPRRDLTPG
jgi:hypothetical protein